MSSAVRTTLIYGVGSSVARVVSFLMLPVYTHYIVPSEYAKLALLLMTVDILGIAVSAGTTAGFLRFYYKATEVRERHQVVFSALLLNAALNLAGAAILFASARLLAGLVLSSPDDAVLFRILSGCFLLEGLIGVPLLLMQAEQKAVLFVATTLGRTIISALLNLLFLIGFGWGVRGMLIGTLITHSLLALAGGAWTVRQTGWAWSRDAARNLRRFGVPYQIAAAGSFVLTFGDRYVLKASRPLAEVGLYSFGYQFGFLLWSVTATPFFQSWGPTRYRQLHLSQQERDGSYSRTFLFLNLVIVTAAVALALGAPVVIALLTPPAYHAASDFVPIILAAYVIQSWSETMQFGIDASEQTRYATIAFWSATIATVALYFLLIPPFGAYGAAVATLLGFSVRFGLSYRFAQRLTPIAYHWAPIIRLVTLAALLVISNVVLRPAGLPARFALACVFGLAYLVLAWIVVLSQPDRVLLRSYADRLLQRILPATAPGA